MVYTNISSTIRLKSLINCPEDVFISTANITEDINLQTHSISFNESGINKTIKNERIIGGVVSTSITRPTQTEIDLTFLIDGDILTTEGNGVDVGNITISGVHALLGDFTSTNDYSYYSESDTKRRHRLALLWTDGTNTFMKVYYNAYVQNINVSNAEMIETHVKFVVPIMDIHTGNSNYYEYEGSDALTILNDLDVSMGWANS